MIYGLNFPLEALAIFEKLISDLRYTDELPFWNDI